MKLESARLRDQSRWLYLSAVQLAGRRFWLLPILALSWPLLQTLFLALGWRREAFEPSAAQNFLIGGPLALLAIFLGVRVIAGELEKRTLELAYSVPGGAHRVWIGRLAVAGGLLVASELLLAVAAYLFFTPFPLAVLYGALQPASFYLVLSMGLAVFFRSEVTGAMAALAILAGNGIFTVILGHFSPFWNPLGAEATSDQLLAWGLQNRAGFLLATVVLIVLAFSRAENREKMLGS